MPKVSAVMALYNTPYELLQATIESILKQSLKDFELIIIDDASTIDYRKFLSQFNDVRIKYLKLEKNAGPGHARNVGIKKAQGDYVAIVDSDDVYNPKRFERQADFLDQNPTISLVSGAFQQSNNGRIPPVIEDNDSIKAYMLFNSPIANPLVMFRRAIFVVRELFYPEDKNFAEDYELWIDAMFKDIRFGNLNEVLMTYTRRGGQLSSASRMEQVPILKSLYAKIFNNLGFEPTHDEINLHFSICFEGFKLIKSRQEIIDWFNKIIEHNRQKNIFSEKILVERRNATLKKYDNFNDTLFKVKIGDKNLSLGKGFSFKVEDRE